MRSFRGPKFFTLLFIAFLFLGGIYFLLPKQSSISPTKFGQEEKAVYIKRQFDVNKNFFNTEPYPNELIAIGNKDLIGMKCSPEYVRQAGGEYTLGTDPGAKLEDISSLEVINNLNKTITNNYIAAFTMCDTESGMRIMEYEIWSGGGGLMNTAYFGMVKNAGSVEEVTSIKNDGSAYFICNSPLQLTVSNVLYYSCGGGDGGSGSASIYKIDLNNKSITRILRCDSSANPNGKPLLQCQ